MSAPKKKPKDAFDKAFDAIDNLKVVQKPVEFEPEILPVRPLPEIDVINFIAAAPIGHTAEACHSVHKQRYIAGEYVKYGFDEDPRFIRVTSAGGSVDLVPLTNVASIHLKKENA